MSTRRRCLGPGRRLSLVRTVEAVNGLCWNLHFLRERMRDGFDSMGRAVWTLVDTTRHPFVVRQESMIVLPAISRVEGKRMKGHIQRSQCFATAHAGRCANEPQKRVGAEWQA
jgi:hypothetical protein